MAGSVITSETKHRSLKQVKFAWTSSAGGAADSTTTEHYTGAIIDAVFLQGTTPTTAYDVVITDGNSVDVLNALGANIDSSATLHKTYKDGLGAVVESKLTLAVTNAGNAKSGTIILTIAP